MKSLNSVNLELLRVFHAVAGLRSMTLAAKALFVTQPAVSHAMRQLEEDLGTDLFVRMPRRLELTPEGAALYETTTALHAVLQEGQRRLENLGEMEEGDVSIVLPFRLLDHFLLPYLKSFHRQWPKIRIHIQVENRRETLRELVREGKVDFSLEAVHDAEAIAEPLELIPLVLYRNYFAASRAAFGALEGKTLSLAELNRHPLIVLRKGSDSRAYLEEVFLSQGLEMNIGFECDTSALVDDLTRAGLGIGALIRRVGDEGEAERPELFEVTLRKELKTGHFVIIKRRNEDLSRAARRFTSMLSGSGSATL